VADQLALSLERVVPGPPASVFDLHAEPASWSQWFGPKGFSVRAIEVDLRVGGAYRLTMQPPEGDAFVIAGEFREIVPGTRLAYTFRYEQPDPDDRETVVVFALRDVDGATAVTVEQGPFLTEARRSLHVQGWSDSLDRLEVLVERSSSEPPTR